MLSLLATACGGPTQPVRDLANAVEGLHREVAAQLPAWSAGREASIPGEIDALMPAEAHRAIDRFTAREKALADHRVRTAAFTRALEAVPPVLTAVREECDAADAAKRGVDVGKLRRKIIDAWVVVEVRGREAGGVVPPVERSP